MRPYGLRSANRATRSVIALTAFILLAAARPVGAQGSARPAAASRSLRALIDAAWNFELRENPLTATGVGDPRFDDRLPGMAPSDLARRRDSLRVYLARVGAVDRRSLDGQDRINVRMLEQRFREWQEDVENEVDRVPILADDGFHIALAALPDYTPHQTSADITRYVARLRQVPRYFREYTALMRRGLATGFTMPRVVLDGYEVTIASHVVSDPAQSVFFKPLTQLPASMPAAERDRLRAEAGRVITDSVVPAYRDFLQFMTREYIPGTRTTTGARDLPGGPEHYIRQVRRFTTLELAPDSIHSLGVSEVARIRREMEHVMRRTGFRGTFAEFLQMLRSEPRFYAKTPEELMMRAAWIAKRMDGRLPSLFKTLPRQPYGVDPVPAHLAPKYTGGRYVGAPKDGTESGKYWVNTYALENRPLYVLESLTLHEAVPGHHLQTALSQELEGLPPFRRQTYISAFGEGWGLYSERLGLEAGFYTDPYSDFGRLTYEMWRACRLVVDTGLHWKGWTRDQVMRFMAENTALSLHEVRTETDRYIAWPGQALAYKIGELTIRQLRADAEKALGDRFDIREFHDAVLRNGSVPLPVLQEEVGAYIAAKRRPSA